MLVTKMRQKLTKAERKTSRNYYLTFKFGPFKKSVDFQFNRMYHNTIQLRGKGHCYHASHASIGYHATIDNHVI